MSEQEKETKKHREEAIEWIKTDISRLPNTPAQNAHKEALEMAIKALEQKPKWIPVIEKLPNDRDWYLGIFREPDTGWINPLPFVCDYVGHETKATTKEHWILRGFTDRDEHIDYYFNLECVAWMPLSKPYEPQESEVQDADSD